MKLMGLKQFVIGTTVLITLLSQSIPSFGDGTDTAQWKCSKGITLSGEKEYKAFYLDQEVYKYAKSDLSDLRIIDGNGEFVSYYLQDDSSFEKQGKIAYKAALEDKFREKDKKLEKNDTFIDFRLIPDKEGADFPVNKLFFKDVPSQNFFKNIEVYGSFDGVEWTLATKDSIYRVDNMSKLSLTFNEAKKFKFYRIKILQNLENIQIGSLEAQYDFRERMRKNFIKTADMKNSIESKDKKTIITLDNSSRLKIKKINLDVSGNFNRRYDVRVNSEDSFISAGISGDLYNVDFKDYKLSKKNIDLSEGLINSEKLQVVIYNNDDRPLEISSINVEYQIDKVVFQSSRNNEYRLIFGNPSAARPSYDIEKYNGHIENEGQDECTLEKLIIEDTSKSEATEEKINYKLILNIVIGVLSIGLILLIARKLSIKKS